MDEIDYPKTVTELIGSGGIDIQPKMYLGNFDEIVLIIQNYVEREPIYTDAIQFLRDEKNWCGVFYEGNGYDLKLIEVKSVDLDFIKTSVFTAMDDADEDMYDDYIECIALGYDKSNEE